LWRSWKAPLPPKEPKGALGPGESLAGALPQSSASIAALAGDVEPSTQASLRAWAIAGCVGAPTVSWSRQHRRPWRGRYCDRDHQSRV